jgi:hypothetical protein
VAVIPPVQRGAHPYANGGAFEPLKYILNTLSAYLTLKTIWVGLMNRKELAGQVMAIKK